MSWSSLTTLAGVGVTVVGLATVLATTFSDGPATPETSPEATVVATPEATTRPETTSPSPPEIRGVPGEVTRLLFWKGAAESVTPLGLSGVPTEVGSVLLEYGVPLRVPLVSSGDGG